MPVFRHIGLIWISAAIMLWAEGAKAWVGIGAGTGYAQASLAGPMVAPSWIKTQNEGDVELGVPHILEGGFTDLEVHGGYSESVILNGGVYARRYQLRGSWDHMHYYWNSLEYGPRAMAGFQGQTFGLLAEASWALASGFSLNKQGTSTDNLDDTPTFTRTESFFGSYNSGTLGLKARYRPARFIAFGVTVESAIWDLVPDDHYEVRFGEKTAYSAGFLKPPAKTRVDVKAVKAEISLEF